MFVRNTELEVINREISALQSILDEQGRAEVCDLNAPRADVAVGFIQQSEKNRAVISAALLLKLLDMAKVEPVTVAPELAGKEEQAMVEARKLAVHNIICALMVLRALS